MRTLKVSESSRSSPRLSQITGRKLLIRTIAGEDGSGRAEKNFHIEQQRLFARILQVQPYHLVKLGAAASIDLPESGDSWTRFKQAAAVPHVIRFYFVR